ncbi:thioredoxin [Ectothiorhodospira variabilis]|uniref:thioredoxin n=1 Tax=Ectothiorhodospira variabilis TaxID=505694 RepID=UPI001EFBD389|nr:thioredoxin [Ectothiorhodospira variabilis]MCG5495758.1 thioredoxin [Ectothiorhodospira variabilis]MCG5505215.1 thioredoxin [Ectothiorhodospira variabilis]MCG5508348.1 thioredoxin [Ectothiorhodospira variabilis]
MTDRSIHVVEADFEQEVLHSPQPVLVHFWASWCAPCTMITAILRKVTSADERDFKVVRVDTDANPSLLPRYEITGIPTLVIFKQGEVAARFVGAPSKSELMRFIDEHV